MQKKSRKRSAQKSLKDGQTFTEGIRKGDHGEKRKMSGLTGSLCYGAINKTKDKDLAI
jgi:hypothetical protein